jgi:formate hydrogenlyase transcriptional activator
MSASSQQPIATSPASSPTANSAATSTIASTSFRFRFRRCANAVKTFRYFVQNFSRRLNKTVQYVPADAMDALVNYAWPGNIRELENLIERAVLLSPGKELRVPLSELKQATLSVSDVSTDIPSDASIFSPPQPGGSAGAPVATLEEAERQHILRALRQTEWRIAGPKGAASVLGMKRTTLQARMRKLNIRRPV